MVEQSPSAQVTHNRVFDCLAVVNLWQSGQLETMGYAQLEDQFTSHITESDYPILALFQNRDVNALQLCEFLVDDLSSDDVEGFCSSLKAKSLLDYLVRLFDGEYSTQTLESLLNGEEIKPASEVYTIINPFEWRSDLAWLHEPLLTLLQAVDQILQPMLKAYQPGLMPFQKQLHKQLAEFAPLDVAQQEMAKQFIRVSDYQTIQFVISPFVSRVVRFFNEDTMLVFTGPSKVTPIRDQSDAVNLFKLLADDTRLSILQILLSEKLYGKKIAERLGKTTATVSHHLDALHSAGLIRQEKQQQTKYYSFHIKALDNRFQDVLKLILKYDLDKHIR